MSVWRAWRGGFDRWEGRAAAVSEQVLGSPLFVLPAGALLGAFARAKGATDRALERSWRLAGLATRRDQERILHGLSSLESRLIDLEELLGDGSQGRPRDRG